MYLRLNSTWDNSRVLWIAHLSFSFWMNAFSLKIQRMSWSMCAFSSFAAHVEISFLHDVDGLSHRSRALFRFFNSTLVAWRGAFDDMINGVQQNSAVAIEKKVESACADEK